MSGFSMILAFHTQLTYVANIAGFSPTVVRGLAHLNGKWGLGASDQFRIKLKERFSTISLRGGHNDVDQTNSSHATSSDNFTTNAAEQADAALLKSAMSSGHNESGADGAGVLDNFTSVEISRSGIFKYVLIEAADKQVV